MSSTEDNSAFPRPSLAERSLNLHESAVWITKTTTENEPKSQLATNAGRIATSAISKNSKKIAAATGPKRMYLAINEQWTPKDASAR